MTDDGIGTSILAWKTFEEESYGELQSKVYNDWEGVHDLTSLPDGAAHRHVDKIVLAASEVNPDKIKTAIVCPCTIYGEGRGPDNRRSIQVYKAAESFMQNGEAYMTGKGENMWNQIHVKDLSKLYALLGEAAVAGGPPATWNDQGSVSIIETRAELTASRLLLGREREAFRLGRYSQGSSSRSS